MIRKIAGILSLMAVMIVAGCAGPSPDGPPVASKLEIAELAQGIRALGDDVDPEEAERAARITYAYTRQLALEYQITDPPLIHNMKVNSGRRPRGLCWHWAEDIEARLRQENFRTLDLHRAIANADNPFLIDHSTAIVSRRGDTMFQGVVLDPWRKAGILHWSPVLKDPKYTWVPREKVFAAKRQKLRRAAAR